MPCARASGAWDAPASVADGAGRAGVTDASHSLQESQTVAESGIGCPHDEHCFTASHLENAWVELAHGDTRREQ